MRTILSLLTMIFGFCAAYGQRCASDTLTSYPPGDIYYTGQGFANGGLTPCTIGGAYTELVIPFGTYHQRGQLMNLPDSATTVISNIYSIRIDDVVSLPTGLCWTVRPSNGIIHDNETGVLIIKGTANIPSGSLTTVSVKVSLDTQGNNAYAYTDMDAWSYKPFLGQVIIRTIDSSGNCPEPNF